MHSQLAWLPAATPRTVYTMFHCSFRDLFLPYVSYLPLPVPCFCFCFLELFLEFFFAFLIPDPYRLFSSTNSRTQFVGSSRVPAVGAVGNSDRCGEYQLFLLLILWEVICSLAERGWDAWEKRGDRWITACQGCRPEDPGLLVVSFSFFQAEEQPWRLLGKSIML